MLKLREKYIALIVSSLVMVLVVGTTTTMALETKSQQETVYEEVYIDDINLSGLNREELYNVLQEHFSKELAEREIKLTYNYIEKNVNISELGGYYDIDSIVDDIISIGKGDNIIKDTLERLRIKRNGEVLSFNYSIDVEFIDKYINELAELINTEKKEATFKFQGDNLIVEDSLVGFEVNRKELKEIILDTLAIESTTSNIEIPVDEVVPTLQGDVLKSMERIGTFTTNLPNLNSGRTHNIRTFANKLNGRLIMPGEILSVDEQGGNRTAKEGYTTAPGFINNKVVDIMAGGICQVVTTLYNSVLYADLEIVERQPHSLPVSYVPLGRDATLAKGSIDFKFKNNYDKPIIVQAYVTSDAKVKTSIWMVNENPDKKIVVEANNTGAKSSITYKHTYENTKLVKSEVLSKDIYK